MNRPDGIAFSIPVLGYPGALLARDIRFSLAPGSCVLLAGPNGSGKTTLLRALASGKASMAADSPLKIVYIPTGIPKVKGFTVREFIRTGCYREEDRSDLAERIEEALSALDIADLGNRDLSTLSDGQFQKAILGIALTRRADLLLLDEPTAFLDPGARRAVLATLRSLTRVAGSAAVSGVRPLTILFSSHDIADALPVADAVLGLTASHDFLVSGPDLSPQALLERLFPVA